MLSSFKPVNDIVSAIAGASAETSQLIPDYASPHFYTLKPSSIRKIRQADLIFRIGKNMEIMLDPVFEKLKAKHKLITLSEQANIHFLPMAEGHQHHHHLVHQHETEAEHQQHDGQEEHEAFDPHIWTSPGNAIAMAEAISKALSQAAPNSAADYQHNLARFKSDVRASVKKIKTQLEPVKHKHFVVFHNAWQYFAHDFDLQKPSVISLQEAITPGIKTMLNARQEIREKHIGCVFGSPGIRPQQIQVLTENIANIKTANIDVLGRKLPRHGNGYTQWLEKMAQQVSYCLE